MKEFLMEKWEEEMEELNSRTNPKQKPRERKPIILKPPEPKKVKNEQKYIVEMHKHQRKGYKTSKLKNHIQTIENISDKQIGQTNGNNEVTNFMLDKEEIMGEDNQYTQDLMQQDAESDIREFKSIHELKVMNTVEEIEMFDRLNREQEEAAELQLQSLMDKKARSLINDFTQVKNPFRPKMILERSAKKITVDTLSCPIDCYDLQIENVLLTEQDLMDLEAKREIIYAEKSVKEQLQQPQIKKKDSLIRANDFKPYLKLIGAKATRGFQLNNSQKEDNGVLMDISTEGQHEEPTRDVVHISHFPDFGKEQPDYQIQKKKLSVSEFCNKTKFDEEPEPNPSVAISKNPKLVKLVSSNIESNVKVTNQEIRAHPVLPKTQLDQIPQFGTGKIRLRNNKHEFYREPPVKKRQDLTKIVSSLLDFSSNVKPEFKYVSNKSQKLEDKYKQMNSQEKEVAVRKRAFKITGVKSTKRKRRKRLETKKKKNHIKKNKDVIRRVNSKFEYKKFNHLKLEKEIMKQENESPDRLGRWQEKRDIRKLKRTDSQQKFYKTIRHSLSRISSTINSIDKRSKNSIEPDAMRYNLSNLYTKLSVDKSKERFSVLDLGQVRKLAKVPSNLQLKNLLRSEIQYSGQGSNSKSQTKDDNSVSFERTEGKSLLSQTGKLSLGTGKLSTFLANFSLMEKSPSHKKEKDSNFGKYMDKKDIISRKLPATPKYKPSLNNKKLNYLTSGVNKLSFSSWKNQSQSTKNKIPSMAKTDWLGNLISRDIIKESIEYHTEEPNEFLQSGLPLSVSQQSTQQNSPNNTHHPVPQNKETNSLTKESFPEQRLTKFKSGNQTLEPNELTNLKNNFVSYPKKYNSKNKYDPWNPTIEVDMDESNKNGTQAYNSNLKEIKSLTNVKTKLITRLSNNIDKRIIERFLEEVFKKFKKDSEVSPKDIHLLNKKFFRGFNKSQQRLMPSIYKLIDVEIAIQSKTLSGISF